MRQISETLHCCRMTVWRLSTRVSIRIFLEIQRCVLWRGTERNFPGSFIRRLISLGNVKAIPKAFTHGAVSLFHSSHFSTTIFHICPSSITESWSHRVAPTKGQYDCIFHFTNNQQLKYRLQYIPGLRSQATSLSH